MNRPGFPRRSFPLLRAALSACLALLSPAGCFSTDQGLPPPEQQFYFPTGLSVSPGGKALFVANSDFDLQFRAGTIQALDLVRLRAALPRLGANGRPDCASVGLAVNDQVDAILSPAPCAPIDLNNPPGGGGSLVRASVAIGAFVSDLHFVRRPPIGAESKTEARLLASVRGDPSITWLTVDDDSGGEQGFRLDCGQRDSGRCDDAHRAGIDPTASLRELVLPGEPFDLAVSERTDAILVSHQTAGAVSLLLNGWSAQNPLFASQCASRPTLPDRLTLSFVLSGLPSGATGVAALPMPRLAALYPQEIPYSPAFLVGFRNSAEIDIIRYVDDCASSPTRAFLALTGRAGVNVNAGGFDSRSIVVDDTTRKGCEAGCSDTDKECLAGCAGVPVDVFLANRAPPSLVIGQATGSVSQYGTDDYVRFSDTIPLAQGASQVIRGHIIDRDGQKKPRIFILCFDARLLYVYDPEARGVEASLLTGRGPASLVFDPGVGPGEGAANLAYLAHFTDSYLSVLDLDMRHTSTYLTILANVGVPVPPRESN